MRRREAFYALLLSLLLSAFSCGQVGAEVTLTDREWEALKAQSAQQEILWEKASQELKLLEEQSQTQTSSLSELNQQLETSRKALDKALEELSSSKQSLQTAKNHLEESETSLNLLKKEMEEEKKAKDRIERQRDIFALLSAALAGAVIFS